MKDDHFDDVIKNRLNNHESTVPITMWERIAGKEKERRNLFIPRLYWLLLIVLLLGGTSVLLVADNPKTRSVARANTNTSEIKNKPQDDAMDKASSKNAANKPAMLQPAKKDFKQTIDTNAVAPVNRNHIQTRAAVFQMNQTFSKPHTSKTKRFEVAQRVSKRKNATPAAKHVTTNMALASTIQDSVLSGTPIAPKPIVLSDSAHVKNKPAAEPPIQLTAPPLLCAGLQWSVPFANSAHYFSGINAMQRYAVLLPGVWVSFTSGRNRFALDVQPWAMTPLLSKPFSTAQTRLDATTTRTTTQTLHKISGISAALQSQYNIHSKWWLGGSLQGSFWKKGVVATRSTDRKQDAPNHTIITETKTIKALSFKDPMLADFSPFQLFVNAELLYQTGRWEMGLRTGATFVKLAQREGPAHQFHTALFFRFRLLQKEIKSR